MFIGMIFLMAMFSYLYLYGVHPSFWTAPPSLFWLLPILAAHGCAILLALLARWLLTREGTTLWTSPMLILIAAISLLVSFGFDLGSWYLSDLSPEMSGQGAIVYAFLSLQDRKSTRLNSSH